MPWIVLWHAVFLCVYCETWTAGCPDVPAWRPVFKLTAWLDLLVDIGSAAGEKIRFAKPSKDA
ncbi:MAG: hypothetical protein J6T46_00935 [Victivallales bacterium]|nr:hypothetical protein [Victivallales bacterium]